MSGDDLPHGHGAAPAAVPRNAAAGWEWVGLVVAGVASATALGCFELRLGVPGHAIVRAALPLAVALALSGGRRAGAIVSLSALGTAAGLAPWGVGEFPLGAWLSLALIGPSCDLARGLSGGLTARRLGLLAAGTATNLAAYAAKLTAVWAGWEAAGGRGTVGRGTWPLVSYLACGLLAGAILAAAARRDPPGEPRS